MPPSPVLLLLQIYKKHKMTHRSDRIFAVSELRLCNAVDATILYAASGDGTLIPPFVIFRGIISHVVSVLISYFTLKALLLNAVNLLSSTNFNCITYNKHTTLGSGLNIKVMKNFTLIINIVLSD